VIPNPSLLVIMSDLAKSLQPPTSQQTQLLLLVLLQETSQDGDPDIQLSQLLLLNQLIGLSHQQTEKLLDHSQALTVILNHSSLLLQQIE